MDGTCTLKYDAFSKSSGDSQEVSLYYKIAGLEDVNEATALLESTMPTRLGPLYPHHAKVSPVADNIWDGEAIYSSAKPLSQPIYSIEIGVSTSRFTNSLMTVGSYSNGDPIPDFNGAIGVTKDGIEGVDVNVPTFAWNERHLLPDSQINMAYLQVIYNAIAKMNIDPFRIFDVGEALLIGCTMNQSQELPGWEANFRWIGSVNATNFQVGPITVAEKYGHDYLWTYYRSSTNNGNTVQIPYAVFVERVYQFTDLSALQLDDPTQ